VSSGAEGAQLVTVFRLVTLPLEAIEPLLPARVNLLRGFDSR
jgi:hypothetical protein